jgi:hypothetical protein
MMIKSHSKLLAPHIFKDLLANQDLATFSANIYEAFSGSSTPVPSAVM